VSVERPVDWLPQDGANRTAALLLARLATVGLQIRADGVDLVITPGDRLTPTLRLQILAAKPVLLAALNSAVVCPDCRSWSLSTVVNLARAGYPPGRLYWCSDRTHCGRITWESADF
jgi:hypothetical protein